MPQYAIAMVRYRRPLEEVLTAVDEHRAWLRQLKAEGTLVASGPIDPRVAGVLLLRVPDEGTQAALDRVRDGDPFTQRGLAQYEIWPWLPNIGREDLDKI